MVSRGKLTYIAKLIAIKGLFRYSKEMSNRESMTHKEKALMNEIDNELEPIILSLDNYVKAQTENLKPNDIKVLEGKTHRVNTVLNNTLGYMGAGAGDAIVELANKKRNVKAWDMDIISLYLLSGVMNGDIGVSDSELLRIARFINNKYDLDNSLKFRDRLAHIGRVNTILLELP